MSTIVVSPDRVSIRFTRAEKVLGLVRDLDLSPRQVRSATVVDDGLAATEGLRAPGLGIPGFRKLGTWRGRGTTALVAVRRGEPTLALELDGARVDRVLLSHPQARELAERLDQLRR